MGYLIGTDEAGYGPNLGPLVVSASIWRVEDRQLDEDLYSLLSPLVHQQVCDDERTMTIADSKILYRPGGDLRGLERGVLPAIAIADDRPLDWQQLWTILCPTAAAAMESLPWYEGFDSPIPVDLPLDELAELTDGLQQQLDHASIDLVALRSRAVFPGEFNREVERSGSKGALLSQTTLDLVADELKKLPQEPVRIVCDKHGGRNHYAGLLQPTLAKSLVRVVTEGRQESVYEVGNPEHSIRISFRAKGESFLPSALASMASKYLREIAMRAFNRFWRSHIEDLKPTAGYPVDAKRFKQQIEPTQAKLGILDRELWRVR